MFSLIITIIAIGLTIALALVSYSYLDQILSSNSTHSTASTIVSQASQIAGAVQIYYSSHGYAPADTATLVAENELGTIPKPPLASGGTYTITSTNSVRLAIVDSILCQAIQKKAVGAVAIPVGKPANQGYGCYNQDGALVFFLLST